MKPSEIVALSRLTTNTQTGVVTDIQAYQLLNIVIADFWNDIITMRPWYGMTTWTYNTTGVNSYTWATPIANTTLATSTFGLAKIEKAGIKYDSSQPEYTPIKLIFVDDILNLPDYYDTGASSSYPIGLLFDTSISIYPTPATVTNGLQLIGEQKHFDLWTTGSTVVTEDVEWCILIPANWHSVIIEGLNYWFYRVRGVDFTDISVNQKSYYESEKIRAINQLDNRNQEGVESFDLDLNYLG